MDIVIIAAPLGEHFQLADIAQVWRGRLPGEAAGRLAGGLPPPPRDRTGDRRVIQVGFQSLGSRGLEMLEADAFGIGPVTRARGLVANSRLLEPFAMGGPPQPARPSRCRRGGHEPTGTRGDHGARDRRLSPTG